MPAAHGQFAPEQARQAQGPERCGFRQAIRVGSAGGAHKDAVDLFERYAKGGDNAELKKWAGKTVPALKHHKEMADKLPK